MASTAGQQSSTLSPGSITTWDASDLSSAALSAIDLGIRTSWWKDLRRRKYAQKLEAAWREMPTPSDFETDEARKSTLEEAKQEIESLRASQDTLPSWNLLSVRNSTKQLEKKIKRYKAYASEPMMMLQTAGQNAASRNHHHSMPSSPPPSMTTAVVSQGHPSSSAAPPMASVDSPSPFHFESEPGSPTAAGSSPRRPVFDPEGGVSIVVAPNWQDADGGSSASPPTDYVASRKHHQSTPIWGSPPSMDSAPTYLNHGLLSQGPPSSSAAPPMASMDSPSPFHSESQLRTPTASGSSPHRPMFDAEAMVVQNWQGPDADGGPSASPPTHYPVFQAEMATRSGYPSSSTAPPMASMDSPFPYHSHSRPGNWQDANGERRLMASRSASPPTPYPGFQGEMAPTFGSSPPQGYETPGAVFYGAHGAPSAPTTVIHNHHTHNYAGPALFPGASGQRDFHIDYRSVDGNYYDTHFNGGTLTIESRSPTQTPFRPIPAMVTNGLPGSPPLPLSDSPTEETSIPHVKPLPDGDERLLLLERVAAELSQSAALPDLAATVVCDLRGLVDWLCIVPVQKGKRVLYLSRKTTVECGQFEGLARYVGEACATSNLPSFPLLMGLETISPDSIVPRIADGLYESFPAFRRHWETTYPDYQRPIAYLDGTLPGEGILPSQNQFQHYISKAFDRIPEDERLPILVLIIGLDNRSSVKMRKHVNQCMLDCMRSTHMLFIVTGKKSIAVQDMLQEMRSTSLGISVDT
ncbi:hypothetical protein DFP72DRAFT_1167909 [Ephemerocybe angulata]|uniref:Uncharacterized protein n=1 Tax=Ephemerocybe angulata TaxID=980116 RepID=A0A8H6MBH8_9AGAR|nr:hypothetical protein DFP72DRAFT_1167909 [Tulosesus angulatus]